jgi:hypothetical protein
MYRNAILVLVAAAVAAISCSDGSSPTISTQPSYVSIVAPPDGSTIDENPTIYVTLGYGLPVSYVYVEVDGYRAGSDDIAPYEVTISTGTWEPFEYHEVQAFVVTLDETTYASDPINLRLGAISR